MLGTYCGILVGSTADGPTITAAGAVTMLPPNASATLVPSNFYQVGAIWRFRATGRISCAVTTPGTARYDVRLGGNIVFDSLAIPLNIVAKTNVGWWLEIKMTCRAVSGAASNFFGQGHWQSEALIGSPLATVGGNGIVMIPFNVAASVGGNFNNTPSNSFDVFFTQTLGTGSMTCHQAALEIVN